MNQEKQSLKVDIEYLFFITSRFLRYVRKFFPFPKETMPKHKAFAFLGSLKNDQPKLIYDIEIGKFKALKLNISPVAYDIKYMT